jgi:hypothetical protein
VVGGIVQLGYHLGHGVVGVVLLRRGEIEDDHIVIGDGDALYHLWLQVDVDHIEPVGDVGQARFRRYGPLGFPFDLAQGRAGKPLRRLGDRFLDKHTFDNQKVPYYRCLL